jgi:hypothetical protein
MESMLAHAFFDPANGSMREHFIVEHLNEQLDDRSEGEVRYVVVVVVMVMVMVVAVAGMFCHS